MTSWEDLVGTAWAGDAELWLDPLGDRAERSSCRVRVEPEGLSYAWSHDGKPQTGELRRTTGGATFQDTFHAAKPMTCAAAAAPFGSLLDVLGTYGGEPAWGWRIVVALRPDLAAIEAGQPPGRGELLVQMTNLAPWGEEVRAVRFVCRPA